MAEDDASESTSEIPAVAASTASTPPKQLALGRAHGCSLDPGISGILCWGDNSKGQSKVPTLVSPRAVDAGGDVTCAIASDRVRCWGDNSRKQLNVPTNLSRVTHVAVGDAHVCAATSAGVVRCWGDNTAGQTTVPEGLRDVKALDAGARHTCALTTTGVRCWGDNARGQLTVPALAAPTQLAVGGSHACAIDGGKVVCWGGDDPAIVSGVPQVTDATAIGAGASHACVVSPSGVQCWGDPAATDLKPRDLTFTQQVAVGGGGGLAHACARHQQGVACWGDDSLKQTRYDGAPLHLLYRSASEINAPAPFIWSILMDLDKYPEWNPYTVGMQSTKKVGDPMNMKVKMSPLLTIDQTEHIRVMDDVKFKACWGINTTTPNLNSGERCQWLEPLPNGGTRYITEDLIEGTLNPLVTVLFGNAVRDGFNDVAVALKKRAESLYRP